MKKIAVTVLLLLLVFTAHAQAFTLRGTVVDDEGKPIGFVKVVLQGPEGIGVLADADGKFSIALPDTSKQNVLELSFPSYEMLTYTVKTNENDIRIQMERQAVLMSDVIIVSDFRARSEAIASLSISRARSGSVSADYDRGALLVKGKAAAADSKIRSGTLTVGEVNDFAKWHSWRGVLKNEFSSHVATWGFQPIHRYIAQLTNLQGMPVQNANVTLKHHEQILWQAKTDNTGKAELWQGFFDGQSGADNSYLSLEFDYEGNTTKLTRVTEFEKGINMAQLDVACNARTKVDIFFMVDATGSMGDELAYLKVELDDIIQEARKQQSELQFRVGAGVYRDHGDTYVTRQTKLDTNLQPTLEFLAQQKAEGGGDYPEAVDMALAESIANQSWDDEALARILFIVLDAPSHTEPDVIARLQSQIALAAQKGIRIVPIVCSDIEKNGEYLMRTIALATNGTYLFLTDDSGIGNAHLKPSTDKYEVEKLNQAVVRIIKQYTQMPECENANLPQQGESAEAGDQFIPNPYDKSPPANSKSLSASNIIQVSPNPCSNVLTIKTLRKDVKDVFLVDMTGKMLFGFDLVTRERFAEMDVQALSTGVYFVKAFCEGRWYTVKVLKTM